MSVSLTRILVASSLLTSAALADGPLAYEEYERRLLAPIRPAYERILSAHDDDPAVRAFERRLALVREMNGDLRRSFQFAAERFGHRSGGETANEPTGLSARRLLRKYRERFAASLSLPPLSRDEQTILRAYYNAHVFAASRYIAEYGLPSAEAKMRDHVWIDDQLPIDAVRRGDWPTPGTETSKPDDRETREREHDQAWQFVGAPEHPVLSGQFSLRREAAGVSQHYFRPPTGDEADKTQVRFEALPVELGDVFFAHVYLDPQHPPRSIMLQFRSEAPGRRSWDHRAFWGEDLITPGRYGNFDIPVDSPRRTMGPLPETGRWVRLQVDAQSIGLRPGAQVSGVAFTQFDGLLYWDKVGVAWNPAARTATLCLVVPFLHTPDVAWTADHSLSLPANLRGSASRRHVTEFALRSGRPFTAYHLSTNGSPDPATAHPDRASTSYLGFLKAASQRLSQSLEHDDALKCLRAGIARAEESTDRYSAMELRIKTAELLGDIGYPRLAAGEMKKVLSSAHEDLYGRAAALRLKFLYAAGLLNAVDTEATEYLGDQRVSEYEPYVMYIRWASHERLHSDRAASLRAAFFKRFPRHPLVAEMHHAAARSAVETRDYDDAMRHLEILAARFPTYRLSHEAKSLQARLLAQAR